MSGILPEEIERLALLGYRMYPSSQFSKAGCIKQGPDLATYDLDQLAAWAREFRGCNWRVVMEGSGIWALDVDRPSPEHEADGFPVLAEMAAKHKSKPIPPRPTVRSPSGGVTLVFKATDKPIRSMTGWPKPGLDPRAGRVSINVPPSRHLRCGTPYRWQPAPWEMAPPEAPVWLLKAVAPPPIPKRLRELPPVVARSELATKTLIKAIGKVRSAENGTRNRVLYGQAFWIARWISAGVLGEQEAVTELMAAGMAAGLLLTEVKTTLKSGLRDGFRAEPLEKAT